MNSKPGILIMCFVVPGVIVQVVNVGPIVQEQAGRLQVALQQGDTQGGPTSQVHRVHVHPRPNTGHS